MATRVVLDSNILVLLAYGSIDKQSLGKKRRVKEYFPEDYDIAVGLLNRFRQIVVTPNVITECSDLFSDQGDIQEKQWLKAFLKPCESLRVEEYVPSIDAATLDEYRYLGVADCSLLSLIGEDTVLLTVDSKLYAAAARVNPGSINFNHMRNFS